MKQLKVENDEQLVLVQEEYMNHIEELKSYYENVFKFLMFVIF